jgi:hypothetical protein
MPSAASKAIPKANDGEINSSFYNLDFPIGFFSALRLDNDRGFLSSGIELPKGGSLGWQCSTL